MRSLEDGRRAQRRMSGMGTVSRRRAQYSWVEPRGSKVPTFFGRALTAVGH